MGFIRWFSELTIPIKIVVGAIFGVIAGPGLITYLSEYATYFYAINLGIRPPLEGIPYLSATVAFLSLILAVTAAMIFIITRLSLAFVSAQLIDFVRMVAVIFDEGFEEYKEKGGRFVKWLTLSDSLEKIRNLSFLRVLVLIIFVFVIFYLLFGVLIYEKEKEGNAATWFFSAYTSIAILTLWRKWFTYLVGVLAAISFYVFSWQVLFDFENQEKFLRVIGYGGGIPIRVELQKEGNEKINLYLRTTTALLGLDISNNENVEIPLANVKKIIYLKTK